MPAQRYELGDVDFLDVGEMGNVALRIAHALGDDAANADDLDLLGCRLSRRPQLNRPRPYELRARTAGNKRLEILAQNPAIGAGSRQLRQINTRLMRPPPDSWRCRNAPGASGMRVPIGSTVARSTIRGGRSSTRSAPFWHTARRRRHATARHGRHATARRGRLVVCRWCLFAVVRVLSLFFI